MLANRQVTAHHQDPVTAGLARAVGDQQPRLPRPARALGADPAQLADKLPGRAHDALDHPERTRLTPSHPPAVPGEVPASGVSSRYLIS
jgi:hypothetical protein